MGEFVRVAGTADVQPGQGIVAEVNGQTLAVFNVDGAFHAIDNTCIHRGGPLSEGDLEGSVVTCPWHGWQYDVTLSRLVG
jgi:nitrite reductase (NADH) small subunit